ncbi:unnamed protein product [Vitrella brassicaformis CCMP3155]|uniref:AN1-type domain-containing protein n=2 Tax=Vitrella brassicaformis TaxID=1169539 RepID=A0A0G4F0S1_VITBC|nr:unnamed protein product [Vitrella brassicaformis CCMP3155]|mmetsp:Transcript_32823/g.81299  ORF Transcript_32823/g.81299 Transcript_32823/m.81299 type:complete len:223 (+) Transcript_32823:187-855(+)|eukprot:CEM04661.1 unnamed protein product [Vitrella brassicaformis CCMP3155]
MAEFSDVGAHCSDPYCRQKDFLPFVCNLCNKTYCLEHFKPESHQCPRAAAVDRRVMICPLCLDSFPMVAGESCDVTFERHTRTSCRPDLYETRRAQQKATCPVKGCKAKLTAVNSFVCPRCKQKVCMKHRWQEDHDCRPPQSSLISSLTSSFSSSRPPLKGKAAARMQANKPPNVMDMLRETAHRRMRTGGSSGAPSAQGSSSNTQQGSRNQRQRNDDCVIS